MIFTEEMRAELLKYMKEDDFAYLKFHTEHLKEIIEGETKFTEGKRIGSITRLYNELSELCERLYDRIDLHSIQIIRDFENNAQLNTDDGVPDIDEEELQEFMDSIALNKHRFGFMSDEYNIRTSERKQGRPRHSGYEDEFVNRLAGILTMNGVHVTLTREGPFIRCLDICFSAAGRKMADPINLARRNWNWMKMTHSVGKCS